VLDSIVNVVVDGEWKIDGDRVHQPGLDRKLRESRQAWSMLMEQDQLVLPVDLMGEVFEMCWGTLPFR
jgi:hypothetical protein